MPPCKTDVALASHPSWAQVGVVDMGRAPVDNDIQSESAVCNLDDLYHEEEVVAAFLLLFYGPAACCLRLEILQPAQEVVHERDGHPNMS